MNSTNKDKIILKGECIETFEPVKQALIENFSTHAEIGSAVCIYHKGKKVVDLWGGFMDEERTRLWQENTLCLMYSVAKSISSLAVHILADQGKVDLESPIAEYWPDFAKMGKENIKVRHFLSHWCGVWSNKGAKPGDIYKPEAMARAIENQAPAWDIETKGAYNSVNIGFIAGEIVKRVSNKSIQDFVSENITQPLGAKYYLGVPDNSLKLCADIIPNPADAIHAAGQDPDSPAAAAWNAFPTNFGPSEQNTKRFRTAGVPSFGGFGEARGMAKIYACLVEGGEIDGVRLISSEGIARAVETQWSDMNEGLINRPMAMAMGFMKTPPDGMPLFTSSPDAFGHLGSGGARAFASPSKRVAGCFVSNYQSEKRGRGIRTETIVNAISECDI
ncbi:MAG: hypothetical protein CL568_06495 [Alphaproteobacteria bacterium]|jgi:CubicO group peptidase (beta-lactamase class C family)|nr:hypothetical protein [Alphaproteobacteria bacterium]PPR12476.1 MAG: hypothetical protein CFH42_02162 [Alphaproteobacteria bacterium MarineAlpha12_Bin1]|tara:strand:- start:3737 stop:4906 length:1170 start_codon:yes stop_codon:yes gene_type:complete